MYTVGLDKKSFLILYSGCIEDKSGDCGEISKGASDEKVTTESIDHVKEIVFGSLLGDGRLEMPPRGKNARFGFMLAEKQKDYFIFMHKCLSSLCSSGKYREYSYVRGEPLRRRKGLIDF